MPDNNTAPSPQQSERKKLIERLNKLEFGDGSSRDFVFMNPSSIRVEAVADFILSLLEEETKQLRGEIKKTIQGWEAVKDVDKTQRYEYSKSKCDANNKGEFPDGIGKRWAMPREIAIDEIKALNAALEGK